jgi:D-3-phosphoglycerate dehydrogenase / 2-oxoglutarate reductase
MKKILVTDRVGEEGISYLKDKGYEVIVSPTITAEELMHAAADVDALLVRGRTKVTTEVIAVAKRLKVIGRSGTGVDTIDTKAAQDRHIAVVNAPGANAQSVAEHTMALMLAVSRHIVPAVNSVKAGKWEKANYHGMELQGKTLGILGMGHIGSRVAKLAEAFGMTVLFYVRGGDLATVLKQSDVISIHLPLTDETRGRIGAKELASMKRTAMLINTARGAIVDEKALVSALQEGTIAAAALDVYEKEPLSPDSALLKLTNVILTPHVGADSPESENRASLSVAQDIHRVLQGEKPRNSVV